MKQVVYFLYQINKNKEEYLSRKLIVKIEVAEISAKIIDNRGKNHLIKRQIWKPVVGISLNDNKFHPFIVDQLNKGNISRYTFAELISSLSVPLGSQIMNQYNDSVLIYRPSFLKDDYLQQLNSNRNKIGIESSNDYFL